MTGEKKNGLPEHDTIMTLAKRRGFFWPSFEIYGGVAGFFDYGPHGSLLKDNIIQVWKNYFIAQEGCLQIDTPTLTPDDVFIASGHVEKFEDVLTRCQECSAPFRADHLIEEFVPNAETLSLEEMDQAIAENNVKCQRCGGGLGECKYFNLMFTSGIGPGGEKKAYLRPETAQGIFINFSQLYRMAREKLPFGVVMVGRGYRNEISPRQGTTRIRELNMMECEYFIDPNETKFEKVKLVKDEKLTFIPNTDQQPVEITIGQALEQGILKNETLAYFIGITKRFLVDVGIKPGNIRFRQHLQNEMAHYSKDCWDAETLTGIGWMETVGIADRSAYDITQHMKHSKVDMRAFKAYDEPKISMIKKVVPERKVLGPIFKGDSAKVAAAMEEMEVPENGRITTIVIDGQSFEIPEDAYTIKEVEEKTTGDRFIPSVIEPSYGLDRVIYSALTSSYHSGVKEGEPYVRLELPPAVSPIKAGVFPLMPKDGLEDIAMGINHKLKDLGMVTFYDGSGTIGRRYARSDEIGIPFCVTADYESKDDNCVTIRERDTTDQKRVPIDDVPGVLHGLLTGFRKFSELR